MEFDIGYYSMKVKVIHLNYKRNLYYHDQVSFLLLVPILIFIYFSAFGHCRKIKFTTDRHMCISKINYFARLM